ncbi:predicted protein [Streptomyces sp. SPB78]|nr:predicted protein [Streptomyces sp. SPB78]
MGVGRGNHAGGTGVRRGSHAGGTGVRPGELATQGRGPDPAGGGVGTRWAWLRTVPPVVRGRTALPETGGADRKAAVHREADRTAGNGGADRTAAVHREADRTAMVRAADRNAAVHREADRSAVVRAADRTGVASEADRND